MAFIKSDVVRSKYVAWNSQSTETKGPSTTSTRSEVRNLASYGDSHQAGDVNRETAKPSEHEQVPSKGTHYDAMKAKHTPLNTSLRRDP